jgi:ribose 5-phosphate isomerase B
MVQKKTVYLGADHGGFALKQVLLSELPKLAPDWKVVDLGCVNEESVDYPDYAAKVAAEVIRSGGLGILACGTGIGMSIAANKIDGIRAAEVWDVTTARLSREHNDANVLCLGGRVIGVAVAVDAAVTWLKTEFQGGRHQRRVDGIHKLEGRE